MLLSGWNAAKLYVNTAYQGFKFGEAFSDIAAYCMFIGYPRSGHSLVGALLDAHPQMVIAHEADILKYLQVGFGRRQIFALLVGRSRDFVDSGSEWSGYSYKVPNQWNGRFEKLRIIGDKKGGSSTRRLTSHPELLDRLRRTLKVQVKLLHVVRNPYDNIGTICRRRRDHDLDACIEFYVSLCETNARIRKQVEPGDVVDVRLESVIADPRGSLNGLCRFLGVEAAPDYVDACSSIVFSSPHQSRRDVKWTDAQIDRVKANIDRFGFLHGYRYDD
jgi:hypothetical protein